MIKESQIGNFVSLIKILKTQKKPHKIRPAANLDQQQKRNASLKISNHHKRHINSKKNFTMHKTQNISNEVNFIELKIELKNQAKKYKKYRNYWQQIQKRKSSKFHNFSFRKFPDFSCDGVSSIKYSRSSHKRSSTGNMVTEKNLDNLSNQFVSKIQNQNQLKMKVFRKTMRQKKLSESLFMKCNENQAIKQSNINKIRAMNINNLKCSLQIFKQNTPPYDKFQQKKDFLINSNSKDAWIIDPWQQHLDSKQCINQQQD